MILQRINIFYIYKILLYTTLFRIHAKIKSCYFRIIDIDCFEIYLLRYLLTGIIDFSSIITKKILYDTYHFDLCLHSTTYV